MKKKIAECMSEEVLICNIKKKEKRIESDSQDVKECKIRLQQVKYLNKSQIKIDDIIRRK